MKSFLTLATIVEENILSTYKEMGEEEVDLNFEYRQNSVTVEVIYPRHVDKLYLGILSLSHQLKFENYITEFNISISSSKLRVSLTQ